VLQEAILAILFQVSITSATRNLPHFACIYPLVVPGVETSGATILHNLNHNN
jgi:hypothetical protein